MVLQDGYCEYCGKMYTRISWNWCQPCKVNNLKENFMNWTSGSEKIDNYIQEMQLKFNNYCDKVIEWIPYNQFNNQILKK
jgi:hypothetical protein